MLYAIALHISRLERDRQPSESVTLAESIGTTTAFIKKVGAAVNWVVDTTEFGGDRLQALMHRQSVFRAEELTAEGIDVNDAIALVRAKKLEEIVPGVFSVVSNELMTNFNMHVELAKTVPHGVMCLYGALELHYLTTQMPRKIWMAIEEGLAIPETGRLPVHFVTYQSKTFHLGIEHHHYEGVDIAVYDIERSILDCLLFGNRVAGDVIADEALTEAWEEQRLSISKLKEYAEILNAQKLLAPYLKKLGDLNDG